MEGKSSVEYAHTIHDQLSIKGVPQVPSPPPLPIFVMLLD